MNNLNCEKMLTRKEASEILNVKEGTLATWACNKRYDLKYYKVGSKVLYKLSDIQQFLERNAMGGCNA